MFKHANAPKRAAEPKKKQVAKKPAVKNLQLKTEFISLLLRKHQRKQQSKNDLIKPNILKNKCKVYGL